MKSFIDRNGHRRWKFKLKTPDELLEIMNSADLIAQTRKRESEGNKRRRVDEFQDKFGDSDYFEKKLEDSKSAYS